MRRSDSNTSVVLSTRAVSSGSVTVSGSVPPITQMPWRRALSAKKR
ncbi:hypothetical protein AB1286_32920 [Trinickia sp. NRRL B-1857]